ncbi:DNA-methyltransferase [Litorihabitans aurantiacus]|uniref:DNA-methyltransferase n=1 Tax=Litorihabitans aurantiacus TaxID=1930061 RepID=UPI0024E12DD4|nr:site-specific DNA-methyltransferase [Litorihabitans aurantiacus]
MVTRRYQDEYSTLWQGDALAVLRDLAPASVDALITDPPYSSGGMIRGDRMVGTGRKYINSDSSNQAIADFTGDSRDQRAYAYWCSLWLSECLRIVKPGGIAVLFTDWRQLPATTDALQAGGWVWRGIVPWYKPTARPMPGRFTAACEYVVWGSNGPLPVAFDGSMKTFPGFYQASAPRDREHQTQKPLDVMRSLVKIAPEGSIVLDPFMGSGTTGVAAMNEGRRFVGSELVEEHLQVAERRIRAAAGLNVDHGDQDSLDLEGLRA